ncbi:preprotein translocase subunit SecY [Nanoarchaeota archaeon]
MSIWKPILNNLPEVVGPTQKRLGFKEKLKWTLIILVVFFVLGLMPLFGLSDNNLQQFEFLSIVLGASFGSIISLGIGPIVTASIVLQLLNGSGLVKFDLTSPDGKKTFQGVQKLLALFFIVFEGAIYVFMGGLTPDPALQGLPIFFQLQLILIGQLIVGGILIMFMDEVISKWGFGSGISLFIAAGVSQSIFVQAFNWLPGPTGFEGITYSSGKIPQLFQALARGDPTTAFLALAALAATVFVFLLVVYAQAMKVEIPLSFGRIRGHGVRWPLSFIYTSNIPVILVAALLANIQLWGRLLQNWGYPILGSFSTNGVPESGVVAWTNSVDLIRGAITGSLTSVDIFHSLGYLFIFMVGSLIFSIFWMQTAGMDARSQAKQMMSSGLQIPGFRRDQRVLETILNRYIWPLTVMGGLTVGLIAATADLTGALSRGTGILLAVMIVYKLYEEIAQQHMMDMHPMMRKFME